MFNHFKALVYTHKHIQKLESRIQHLERRNMHISEELINLDKRIFSIVFSLGAAQIPGYTSSPDPSNK